MPVTEEIQRYRSPRSKLLRFFIGSRDGWKEKHHEAKIKLKRITNRAYALKKSRDQWKELARQQQMELDELRCELENQKRAAL
jgi:hypothetical protein